MDGTKRNNIIVGATVMIVQKKDQHSGTLTEGVGPPQGSRNFIGGRRRSLCVPYGKAQRRD